MKNFRVILYIILLLLILPGYLYAQNAAELDVMLEAESVSAAKAARFVLGSAGLLSSGLYGTAAETAAYETAKNNGWITKDATDTFTLKDTAFLIMCAFEFDGGLLYTIFRNPRYAYREMVHSKLIQGRSDPDMTVSGSRLLQIIGRALTYAEENRQPANTGAAQ